MPHAADGRLAGGGAVMRGWTGSWLRGSRPGLLVLALLVGAGSGLGAVAFRYLISAFTWLATRACRVWPAGPGGQRHHPAHPPATRPAAHTGTRGAPAQPAPSRPKLTTDRAGEPTPSRGAARPAPSAPERSHPRPR
jgi:hypothetical protein